MEVGKRSAAAEEHDGSMYTQATLSNEPPDLLIYKDTVFCWHPLSLYPTRLVGYSCPGTTNVEVGCPRSPRFKTWSLQTPVSSASASRDPVEPTGEGKPGRRVRNRASSRRSEPNQATTNPASLTTASRAVVHTSVL